jgi:hypothetical protein
LPRSLAPSDWGSSWRNNKRATKVTPLIKQVITEFPGHEVTMITLDIPPGGGSPKIVSRHEAELYRLEIGVSLVRCGRNEQKKCRAPYRGSRGRGTS